ncbi:MAG: DNA topoisomerase [Vulcanimicrobiaceae bacterium]
MSIAEQEGAHASLQTLGDYDYERVKREFTEDHANVWDLVRRCYAAEESAPPTMDVYRLAIKFGSKWFVALGADIVENGWLTFDERRRLRLKGELPSPPSQIEEAVNQSITLERVSIEPREPVKPSPADMIRMMRDGRIGRPSTYHQHITNLSEMVDSGYVTRDADGRYELTKLGRAALGILRAQAFPAVGIQECAELERDLVRIESGEAASFDIAVKHVSLVKNVASLGYESREDAPALQTEASVDGSALPAALDPERNLPQNHRLRRIKNRIATVVKRRAAGSSNQARSSIRAAIAYAAADIWRLSSESAVLDELRFNLAYRWLCGLEPDDPVWSETVFRQLLAQERDLVSSLKHSIHNDSELVGTKT